MTSDDAVPDFVPGDFVVPVELSTESFRLEPLGPEHNARDYAAWQSSIEHIRATPGFAGRDWPHEMTLEENLGDLRRHAEDFAARTGFTYTVLAVESDGAAGSDIIGCVYIYPPRTPAPGTADVRSWVRADRAQLDVPLYQSVTAWLRQDWPFGTVRYAPR